MEKLLTDLEVLISQEYNLKGFKLSGKAKIEAEEDLYNTKDAHKTFGRYFSKEGLYPKEAGAFVDVNCNQPTTWGFLLDSNGVIYHINHQYCHGTMLAILHPEECLKYGLIPPRKESKDNPHNVYLYQDFEFAAANRLGYLRFGSSFYFRLSFNKDILNEKHVASLKKWFYNNDMLDMKIVSDWFSETTCRKLVSEMDALAQHNKVNNIVYEDIEDDVF